jgi:hypothetical protein
MLVDDLQQRLKRLTAEKDIREKQRLQHLQQAELAAADVYRYEGAIKEANVWLGVAMAKAKDDVEKAEPPAAA